MGGILIAVPLFKAPELIIGLFGSLAAMAPEIAQLSARVLLVNDSPGDADLLAALEIELPILRRVIGVEVVDNDANLGFVRSANRAFAIARESGEDLLLLNSDALPRPGAFAEMAAVAQLDLMISVVSPRSDNATICNSPYPPSWRNGLRDRSYANHRAIEAFLPRYSFVPTAVGFCLLIRHAMIAEFGDFDEVYGGGYNEENDFIRRCNRRGYRAVLANRAYVHHLGGVSFAKSAMSSDARENDNRAILDDRYPEYGLSVQRYFDGPEYRAQMLTAGLIPDDEGRLRVLFDCRTLECSYKGTFEHACALLKALGPLAAPDYDIFVLCERAAFDFHGLDSVIALRFCERDDIHDRPFAFAMRPVQPFLLEDIVTLGNYAPITGVLMLDTIAMDCQQLDTHGLDVLWRFMTEAVSMIGYNSGFTREQFTRRIDVPPHVTQFVSRCSTDVADYAGSDTPADTAPSPPGDIFVVGNGYPHKFVSETIDAIGRADPAARVSILGADSPNVAAAGEGVAGHLAPAQVEALYADARCIVYPSHYEGFGLPILHGLAHHTPVIARDLPSAREIAERAAGADNLYLCGSTAEIVERALRIAPWKACEPRSPREGWREAAQAVLDAFADARRRFDFATCRRQQASLVGHRARLDAERRFHEQAATADTILRNAQADADRRAREADLEHAATRDREARLAATLANTATTLKATDARLGATLRALTMLTVRLTDAEQAGRRAEDHRNRADLRTEAADRLADDLISMARGAITRLVTSGVWEDRQSSILSKMRARIGRQVVDLDDLALPMSSSLLDDITLETRVTDGDPEHYLRRALIWSEKLRIGGSMRLSWPAWLIDDLLPGYPRDRAVSVILACLGIAARRVVVRQNRCRADGIRIVDVMSPLPGPAEDDVFLTLVYRFALDREPDPESAGTYLAKLASGANRADVLRTLLASRERLLKLATIDA